MRFGIGLPNQVRNVNPAIIPAWAAGAERAGFSTLGTVGRFAYPGVVDTIALAAAAGATSSIELINNVLLAPTWPAPLLAKEMAGIDGVSGGRLTVGLGLGGRADDFVVDGLPMKGLGKRFDADLEIYRDIWAGKPYGDSVNPAVPQGTRQVPILFGGMAKQTFTRMAKWGTGYIGGSVPASMVADAFDAARAAWTEAGREGSPRLVGIAYFAFNDGETGRANVYDYYSFGGDELAGMIANNGAVGPDEIAATIKSFEDIGADDMLFNPMTADPAEIERLAELLP
jgi:alkanesulfonate monooxygenase SsuD/methylene tetrahydromethanopterin reductase-like flavin-dependent oxidoreductase (luciferase family)